MPKAVTAAKNRVRIIGGTWRSRIIAFPDLPQLRPTPDRVRETIFNWLGQNLTGWSCLDLFAGSGALGFEAASRGATRVVMVDHDREVCTALERSARNLGADAVTIRCEAADAFLACNVERFDLIFLDPPYSGVRAQQYLPHLLSHLAEGGVVYLESDSRAALGEGWQALRESRAGQVRFLLAERTER
jgi:16S rRNA (guanine(966)-N(2))-methyltransferase RsmD